MATNNTPTAEHVQKLRVMVERSASRWKQLIILEALGLVIAAPLAYLWLVFILDNMFHLPRWGRIVASLGFLVALIFLVSSLVKRWRKIHFTEDQVALAMEKQTPGVQNRLINAIQLSRDQSVDTGFSQAVIEENYARLQQIEVHQAAQIRPAMIRVGVALLVILFGVGFFVLQGEHFKNAMARIMMPFADVDPIYQTVLHVEQGPLQKNHDVTIKVAIQGRTPKDLTILKVIQGERATENVQVGEKAKEVTYTFKGVEKSMTFAVRGNDYLTEYFRIEVPAPSTLSGVKVTYNFPAYTKLPPKTIQMAGGDLEALLRTKATVNFIFDQPADEATMLLQKLTSNATPKATGNPATKPSVAPDAVQRIALKKISPTEYSGEITFVDVLSYQLETMQPKQPPHLSGRYALRVRADQDPTLDLSGLGKQTDSGVDAVLPVKITASDDYGLDKIGLFARKVLTASASLQTDVNAAPAAEDQPDGGWTPIEVWPANGVLEFTKEQGLSVAAMGAIEGEKYEVALRASDTDPDKKGALRTGDSHLLLIGGDGATLQLLYEQIIQSEKDLKALLAAQQAGIDAANVWIQKLEPASGLRWDDKANLDSLVAAMKAQAAEQVKVRTAAGRVARDMVEQTGSLRMGLGMLADTEMVRAISILEAVPNRDNPQEKRAALADGRLTQERTLRSMKEMAEQYERFRKDWEFSNMIPFVKMLAERQASMRDEATKRVGAAAAPTDAARQASTGRRQLKLVEMVGLSQVAFTGMVERVKGAEPILSKAFTEAAAALAGSELKNPMNEAAEHAKAGRWAEAAKAQDTAAKQLALIHNNLREAQAAAAKAALAAIKEEESTVKKQGEIGDLKDGSTEKQTDFNEKELSLEDILRMGEAAKQASKNPGDVKVDNYLFSDDQMGMLNAKDTGMRQNPNALKLATSPTGISSFPNSSDRAENKVGKPPIDEHFKDLMGPLLDEADNNMEKWETYNLTTTFNINEPGDIGKIGGDMNSTAAAAATGNQKQPPHDVGGISRSGRDGARAHGLVLGDEDKNLRGMDNPQEGAERSPDQEGRMKSKEGDDPNRATATGMGGKTVESDNTKFNPSEKGHFTEDMAKRMEKPQAKNALVERADGFVDPKLIEMLHDLTSTQEQLIERVKAIKKELQMLYQPTEQIDELLRQLQANLDSLKERPTADVFKLQMRTLDGLRNVVRVFSQPGSNYSPSLPREQAVKGRVLDDPARQTMPGYEEAVKQYYQMLSQQ